MAKKSGITSKKYNVSSALADLLGSDKAITRPEATKKIWAIYKKEGMTAALKKVVGSDMSIGPVARGLSKHLEAVE